MGAAFILHGLPKIQAPFSWMGNALPPLLQLCAAVAEFGGGIALVLGLLTPFAALGLLITMLVAVFAVHVPAGHPFVSHGKESWELAAIYGMVSFTLLCQGAGAYSLDACLLQRLKRGH
jgi:putative oxidoreductase